MNGRDLCVGQRGAGLLLLSSSACYLNICTAPPQMCALFLAGFCSARLAWQISLGRSCFPTAARDARLKVIISRLALTRNFAKCQRVPERLYMQQVQPGNSPFETDIGGRGKLCQGGAGLGHSLSGLESFGAAVKGALCRPITHSRLYLQLQRGRLSFRIDSLLTTTRI